MMNFDKPTSPDYGTLSRIAGTNPDQLVRRAESLIASDEMDRLFGRGIIEALTSKKAIPAWLIFLTAAIGMRADHAHAQGLDNHNTDGHTSLGYADVGTGVGHIDLGPADLWTNDHMEVPLNMQTGVEVKGVVAGFGMEKLDKVAVLVEDNPVERYYRAHFENNYGEVKSINSLIILGSGSGERGLDSRKVMHSEQARIPGYRTMAIVENADGRQFILGASSGGYLTGSQPETDKLVMTTELTQRDGAWGVDTGAGFVRLFEDVGGKPKVNNAMVSLASLSANNGELGVGSLVTATAMPSINPGEMIAVENPFLTMPMVLEAKDFDRAPVIDSNNKEQMKLLSKTIMERYNRGEFNQINPDAVPFEFEFTKEIYGDDGMMHVLSVTNSGKDSNLDPEVSGPIFKDVKGNAIFPIFMKQKNGVVGLIWSRVSRKGIESGGAVGDFNLIFNYLTNMQSSAVKMPINFDSAEACIKFNRGVVEGCDVYDLRQEEIARMYSEWQSSGLIPREFREGEIIPYWLGLGR